MPPRTETSSATNPLAKDSERSGRPNASKYVISRSDALYAPNAIYPKTGTLRSVHTINAAYTTPPGEKVAFFHAIHELEVRGWIPPPAR